MGGGTQEFPDGGAGIHGGDKGQIYTPIPPHHKLFDGFQAQKGAKIWYIGFLQIDELYHKVDGQPPSPRWSPTIPRMVIHQSKSTRKNQGKVTSARDGHPPLPRWSPIIQNLLRTWNLAHRLNLHLNKCYNCHRWSAIISCMVSHHPRDGLPPFKMFNPKL